MAEKTVTVKIEDLPKVQELLNDARRLVEWHTKIRLDIESVLDEVLGTEAKDGAGEGIVADVRLALAKERAAGVQAGRAVAASDAEKVVDAYEDAQQNPARHSDDWWKGWDAAVDVIRGAMNYGVARGDTQEGRSDG